MYWSQTESSKWSLCSLSFHPRPPFTLQGGVSTGAWCLQLGQLVRAGLYFSQYLWPPADQALGRSPLSSRSDNPGSAGGIFHSSPSLGFTRPTRGSHTHVHGIINLPKKTPGLRCTPRVVTTHQSRTAAVLYKLGLEVEEAAPSSRGVAVGRCSN